MTIVRTALIGCGAYVVPVILCRKIEIFLNSSVDAAIQDQIVPRWKERVKESFDRWIAPDSRLRRLITVIIPNNAIVSLISMQESEQIALARGCELLPISDPTVAALTALTFLTVCWTWDWGRRQIARALSPFPRYYWIWAPSDYPL